MSRTPWRVVGYLARAHGLAGLEALVASPRYRPVLVLTHRRRPKAEDPERGEREDFARFVDIARRHGVPLLCVDGKREAEAARHVLESLGFDLIASISWRRTIPPEELCLPRIGGVNLHRGALPEYAGALPVHRALADGCREVAITAHVLTDEIDAGEVIDVVRHPVDPDPRLRLDEHVERVKQELTPLFGPLLLRALDRLVADHERA
jgi:methionyl-tRNA formyltransferase